ncbi:MAG: hypothetical protein PWP57_34 [Candidatus Atribacteria bacterium]|nr:hypothetical protein [Candidatus Atribacteria bacterium]
MKDQEISETKNDLNALCVTVRELITAQEYQKCESLIYSAMSKYPHASEPHNLIGVLLEKKGDHLTAMKHFRAAWALDPTYIPARQNLECYGTFFSHGKCAYDESDCLVEEKNSNFNNYKIEYDTHGIGRVVRRD